MLSRRFAADSDTRSSHCASRKQMCAKGFTFRWGFPRKESTTILTKPCSCALQLQMQQVCMRRRTELLTWHSNQCHPCCIPRMRDSFNMGCRASTELLGTPNAFCRLPWLIVHWLEPSYFLPPLCFHWHSVG